MRRSGEFWELAACGAAAGGISVWAVAAAARAGWLRALLDLFPRSTWDGVTWALIPLLLLVPMMLQGTVVAEFSARPRPIARTISATRSLQSTRSEAARHTRQSEPVTVKLFAVGGGAHRRSRDLI